MTRSGDLCDSCFKREENTIKRLKVITGVAIGPNSGTYLHGRVTDVIPFWSHIYDGYWYRLKIEEGYTVSEAVMAKAKKAAEVAYEGVTTVEPQSMPAGKKPRAKKATVEPVAPPVTVKKAKKISVPVAAPVPVAPVPVAPEPVAPPPVAPAKKTKAPKDTTPPVAVLDTKKLPVDSIVTIQVRKTEVDGRSLYLDPRKEKLYDLKFKYIGRLKDGQIHSFPDSDAEL